MVQGNLAIAYGALGQDERALSMERDIYSKTLKLYGKEDEKTLRAAMNCASSLADLKRFEEARSLLRKTMPVARRVLGEDGEDTIRMRWLSASALYMDASATLDDLREAVTTLGETTWTARRVFGGSHPITFSVENRLRDARAALRARESPPSPPPSSESV